MFPSVKSLVASLVGMACAVPLSGQTVRVTGTVRDGAGAGIVNAEVSVEGGAVLTRTDSLGQYRLTASASGRLRLLARRLGYRPEAVEVVIPATGVITADFRLDVLAQSVETVTITSRMSATDRRLQGFYARANAKNGGYFIPREQIERRNASNSLQLLRGVPGVHILGNSRLGYGVRLRGNKCAPLVFIDGFPASAGAYDFESIDPASVEGIEIHAGLGSVPPEFLGPRGLDQCGVIAIWGRQAAVPRGDSRLRRVTSTEKAASRVKAMLAASMAYASSAVDLQALLQRGTFTPAYPPSLLSTRVSARVHVEFVVDTAGRILWDTYSVVASTDSRFNAVVREALLDAQFSTAVRAGRRVAQVVQVATILSPPVVPGKPR